MRVKSKVKKKRKLKKTGKYRKGNTMKTKEVIRLLLNPGLDNGKIYRQRKGPSQENLPHTSISFSCLNILREAIVSQRFRAAIAALTVYPNYSRHRSADICSLYQGGWHVVSNVLKDETELQQKFCEHFIKSPGSFSKELLLDYMISMLENGKITEALNLKAEYDTERVNFKTLNGGQKKVLSLLRGYEALINYILWFQKKIQFGNDADGSETLSHIRSTENMLSKAKTQLSTLLGESGLWDIFVIRYLHILLTENEIEEAETMLRQNVELNSHHLNAHIYLCEFLHQYESDYGQRVKTLKNVLKIDPSNILLLRFIDTVSWKKKERPKLLKRVFRFLDYSCNKDNEAAWTKFSKLLTSVLAKDELASFEVLVKCWDLRYEWWPRYHFSITPIQNRKLLFHKALVAAFFFKRFHPYLQMAYENIHKAEWRCQLVAHQKALKNWKMAQDLKYCSSYYVEQPIRRRARLPDADSLIDPEAVKIDSEEISGTEQKRKRGKKKKRKKCTSTH